MWLSWRLAMERALYGDTGFYRREGAAAGGFRTSVHASERFAAALATLVCEVDAALGRPARLDVVDVGAGDGRLLVQLQAAVPSGTRRRLRLVAVERGPRPGGLPADLRWATEPPDDITGLVVANEWLDNVPVDVVELAGDGPRLVLVDTETGEQRLGGVPAPEDRRWLDRWWPLAEPGDRAEVGLPRDEQWQGLAGSLRGGLAVAIDYGHTRAGRPACGTLTGYRSGRQVRPVPDGSCDITAHVALDSCAARTGSEITTQRQALRALGIEGRRPRHDGTDPRTYLRQLRTAAEEGELIDPSGLGGFGWLVHAQGMPVPGPLRGTISR